MHATHHKPEARHHQAAKTLLTTLAGGSEPWALPWRRVYEFLRVVTHPRVSYLPTDLDEALGDLETLFSSPSLVLRGSGLRRFGIRTRAPFEEKGNARS